MVTPTRGCLYWQQFYHTDVFMPYTRPLSLQRFIGIALLTLTVTWLSRFTSIAGDISLIWPVTGISVAAALLWGPIATLAVGCGVIGWAALSNFSPQAWPRCLPRPVCPV